MSTPSHTDPERPHSCAPAQLPTLLVIDDTPAGLGVVCETLSGRGIRILVSESAEAARRVLGRTTPDIILLDVVMPGENGFEFCASLKADARWRGIPVIFLTAIDAPEQKVKAFTAGAADYVTKPVHVPELVARVQVQLDLLASRRVSEAKNQELEAEVALRLDAENQLASSLDRAIVLFDQRGEILFATRLAHDLIAKYMPNQAARLPELGSRVEFGGSVLNIRRFTEGERRDLLMVALEEEHASPGPLALLSLGLTPRQAEVAYWVAQGKSNPEIAIILSASPRTIDKHMERIFSRLGVENRSSLIVVTGDLLRPRAAH